jgi:hypothetical protein
MTYHGYVKNGLVVLDDRVMLPEGAKVKVDLLEAPADGSPGDEIPTLFERLKPFIGKADGLPADLAENHDHYLYGVPKRS